MCCGGTPITPCSPATADLAGPHRFYARSWPLRLLERPTAGAPTATPDAGRRPPPLRGPSGVRRPSVLNPCSPGGTPRAAEPIRGPPAPALTRSTPAGPAAGGSDNRAVHECRASSTIRSSPAYKLLLNRLHQLADGPGRWGSVPVGSCLAAWDCHRVAGVVVCEPAPGANPRLQLRVWPLRPGWIRSP